MAWDPSYFGNDKSAFMAGICYELAKNRYGNIDNHDIILEYGGKIYHNLTYELIIPDDKVIILYKKQEILRLDRCRVRLRQFALSEDEANKANSLICLMDEF